MPLGTAQDLAIWPYLLQLAVVTAVVAALAYASLRFARDKLPGLGLGLQQAGKRPLRVLDKVAVDAKRVVFVVAAGKRAWLVAATDTHVVPIAELSPEDLTAAGPDFAGILQKETYPGDTH